MKLIEAVFAVQQHSGGNTVICAKEPFTPEAEAVLAQLTNAYAVPEPVRAHGFRYFLGRDDVVDLLTFISRKCSFTEQQFEFVRYYAVHDSYPEWAQRLPDLPEEPRHA